MRLLLENVDASVRKSSAATIPTMAVVSILYWQWSNHPGTIAAILIVALSMLPYFVWMLRRKAKTASLTLHSLATVNALPCAAGALAPWLMMPEQQEPQYFYIGLAFALMIANLADTATLRTVHLAGQIPMVLILSLGFAIGADGTARLMSILIIVMAIYLDNIARTWSNTALQSARLHCKNDQLVEDLREANSVLQHRSTHDYLTGLPNRAAFSSFLSKALDEPLPGKSRQVAVLLIDIDGFKSVNDTLGHHAGDHLLIEAANRLQACVPENAIFARFGGDEMAIAWSKVPSRRAVSDLAEQVNEVMRESIRFEDDVVQVSASVGVTMNDAATVSESQLLRRADIALYAAKDGGKDCHVFFHIDLLEAGAPEEVIPLASSVRPAVEDYQSV